MTEETARLDYSKPPPWYAIAWRTHGAREWSFRSPEGVRLPRPANGCDDLAEYTTQRLALAAAWVHHKAHNDPPGMTIYRSGPAWLWEVDVADGRIGEAHSGEYGSTDGEPIARAAAWAWHDRRHALGIFWPVCLTWTNEQVTEVERWMPDRSMPTPEVLRG